MFSIKCLILNLILSFFYLRSDALNSGQLSPYESAINKSLEYINVSRFNNIIPGMVVGVSINGTQVWTQAFGLTDIENKVNTRVDSVWRMASISKPLTTALVARLVDQGHINLNKSIHEYLKPSIFPIKKWNNKTVTLTVGQVLSHTAGLHVLDYPNDLLKQLVFQNVTQTIAQFKDKPLIFAPGSPGHWNYSDYGYQIVGAIIESVLNETYESAINKMFIELDMNSTFCERREQIVANRARYYQMDPTSTHPILRNTVIYDDLVSLEAQWPSGGILSTVPDLLKFGSHMIQWSKGFNDTKNFNVSERTVNLLWSPVATVKAPFNSSDTYQYGHGWSITTLKTPIVCSKCRKSPIKQVIGHSGGMMGVNTLLILAPDNDIAVTIFLNIIHPDKIHDMGLQLLKYFVE